MNKDLLFNLVALPTDLDFCQKLTAFAQNKYHLTSRGYILGPNSLPHMTLCFYRSETEEIARQIALTVPAFPKIDITVKTVMMYHRPHADGEGNIFSTGFLVRKTNDLQQYQSEIRKHIIKSGGTKASPDDENYWPHFTCAFTTHIPSIEIDEILPWAFGNVQVRIGVGYSDAAGQFIKEIKL